jgi:arabinan endo-1,5-alpha-L-arabinosidase
VVKDPPIKKSLPALALLWSTPQLAAAPDRHADFPVRSNVRSVRRPTACCLVWRQFVHCCGLESPRAGCVVCAVLLLLLGCSAGLAADTNAASGSSTTPARWPQRGQYVHDPSTIAKCGSEYWVFSTGPGISSRHSEDLRKWEAGPRVFSAPPSWTTNAVPAFRGYFWAPDIIHLNDRYLLYYSISTWGVNSSAIGLATNPSLDPAAPNFAWTDEGLVCQSHHGDAFNTIDPSVMQSSDGSVWLAFGSFWTGIKLIQLNPVTGKRISPDSPIYSLAFHDSIEAPCLWQRGDYFYLFVNWGLCCRGTNSTYNIRVGRSSAVIGPYQDKEGKDLVQAGGTLFLGTEGNQIGPGHAGIYRDGETNWFSYHYYDGNRGGAATLAVRQLKWSADGWPALAPEPR